MLRRRDTAQPGATVAAPRPPAERPLLPTYPPRDYLGSSIPRSRRSSRRAARTRTSATSSGTTRSSCPTAGCCRVLGPARPRVRLPRRGGRRGQARARAGPGHRLPDLLHGTHGCRGGVLRSRLRRLHRPAAGEGSTIPRRGCASCRRRSTATTTPGGTSTAPSVRRPRSSRGTSTTCPPISALSTSHWSGPSAALPRALGRPLAGGGADEGHHDRSNRCRTSAATRDQHHALLAFGRAPHHELVVDLSRRGRVHARPPGVRTTEITYHTQRHHLSHDMAAEAIEQPMYTVVGRRGA